MSEELKKDDLQEVEPVENEEETIEESDLEEESEEELLEEESEKDEVVELSEEEKARLAEEERQAKLHDRLAKIKHPKLVSQSLNQPDLNTYFHQRIFLAKADKAEELMKEVEEVDLQCEKDIVNDHSNAKRRQLFSSMDARAIEALLEAAEDRPEKLVELLKERATIKKQYPKL